MSQPIYRFIKKIDAIVAQELFGSAQYSVPCRRIIFVPGIDTHHFKLQWWKEDLEMAFPQCEVVMFDAYYIHTQHRRVAQFIDQLTTLLSGNVPTVILAHSFGGMLVKGALRRLQNHHISLLVTMATPHTMCEMGVEESCAALHIPQTVSVPIITYAGTRDFVVPEKYTHVPGEMEHISLVSSHIGFLYRREIRQEVIRRIQAYLYRD